MTDTEDMTLAELRTADNKEFMRRYWKWCDHALDHEWWDGVEDCFKADMKPSGFDVTGVQFSLSYCQGDYATAKGNINLGEWARNNGYAETHLPLVLDWEEYGAYARVTSTHRGGVSIGIQYEPGNAAPTGVFSDLPVSDWDELVSSQWNSEDWDVLVREWVRDRCSELYASLQKEYEYLTSEDEFIEQEEV